MQKEQQKAKHWKLNDIKPPKPYRDVCQWGAGNVFDGYGQHLPQNSVSFCFHWWQRLLLLIQHFSIVLLTFNLVLLDCDLWYLQWDDFVNLYRNLTGVFIAETETQALERHISADPIHHLPPRMSNSLLPASQEYIDPAQNFFHQQCYSSFLTLWLSWYHGHRTWQDKRQWQVRAT